MRLLGLTILIAGGSIGWTISLMLFYFGGPSVYRGETNSNPPYSTAYNIVFDPLLYFCPKLSPRWHGVLFFPKFGNFGRSSIISKIFLPRFARFTIFSMLSHFFGGLLFFQNFPALRAVLYFFQNVPPRFARCLFSPLEIPSFLPRFARCTILSILSHFSRGSLFVPKIFRNDLPIKEKTKNETGQKCDFFKWTQNIIFQLKNIHCHSRRKFLK